MEGGKDGLQAQVSRSIRKELQVSCKKYCKKSLMILAPIIKIIQISTHDKLNFVLPIFNTLCLFLKVNFHELKAISFYYVQIRGYCRGAPLP